MNARRLARFKLGLFIAVLLTAVSASASAATIIVDPDAVPQATWSSPLLPDVLLTPSDPTLHVVFAETKPVYVYTYGFEVPQPGDGPYIWDPITVIDYWITDPLGNEIPYSRISEHRATPFDTDRSGMEGFYPGTLTGAVHYVFDLQQETTIDVIIRGTVGLSSVPIPPAIYLFGTVILGLIGTSRFKKATLAQM